MTPAATFILIRHAESEGMRSILTGRTPGIRLTPEGRQQAKAVAAFVAEMKPDLLISSPRERAAETASSIGRACDLGVEHNGSFEECDFGDWTGLSFEQLSTIPEWHVFNSFRSANAAPHGESIQDVQYRSAREIVRLQHLHAGGRLAIVTHADVIRSVIAYFAGVPLDLFLRFAIDPASVSGLELSVSGVQISFVNRIAKP